MTRIQTLSTASIFALVSYAGFNSYKLSSVRSIVEDAINRTPNIELSYFSTSILSNNLEVEVTMKDSNTQIIAQISPSFLSDGFSYQIYGYDDYLNSMNTYDETRITIKEVKGFYDFSKLTNQIDFYTVSAKNNTELPITLDLSEIGHIRFNTLVPRDRNLTIYDLISFSAQDVNIFNIAAIDYISAARNLPNAQDIKLTFDLKSFNLDYAQLKKIIPIPGQNAEKLFNIFPISMDLQVHSDKEITDALQNIDQNITQPLFTKVQLKSSTGISYSTTSAELGLKPNFEQDDFDLGLYLKSRSSITNIEKNNETIKAFEELFLSFGQPFYSTDIDLIERNTQIKTTGKVTQNSLLTSLNASLSTKSQYYPNTSKETIANVKIKDTRKLTYKNQYIKLNGEYLDPNVPVDIEKLISIKTNHPEELTAPLKVIASELPKDHVINNIINAVNKIEDKDDPFTIEIYSD